MNFWDSLFYDPDLERSQIQNELAKLRLEKEKKYGNEASGAYDKFQDQENTLRQAQDIQRDTGDNLAATLNKPVEYRPDSGLDLSALNGPKQNADITPENVRSGSVYMGPYNPHAMSDIAEALNKPKIQRMDDFDLPRYAAYDDGIASALNQANKEESQNLARQKANKPADAFGKTPTGLDLRYATDPEYVASQKNILDGFLSSGKITPETYQTFIPIVESRPVSWMSQLPTFLKTKETAVWLGTQKTAQELENERLQQKKLRQEQEARDAAARDKKEAAERAKSNAIEYENNTINKINTLLNGLENGTVNTGMGANFIADKFSSSEAATNKALFDQIKGNLTIGKLLDVKASGGTFGALSDQERQLLERSASNLEFGGSRERNINALNEILNTMNAARKRASSSGPATSGSSVIKYVRDPQTGKLVRQ